MKKHNIFKKLAATVLSAAMLLSLAACGGAETAADNGTTYKIGICNYVDDASLNQIVDNIQTRLGEIGKEQGVKKGTYLLYFTAVNLVFLVLLMALYFLIG